MGDVYVTAAEVEVLAFGDDHVRDTHAELEVLGHASSPVVDATHVELEVLAHASAVVTNVTTVELEVLAIPDRVPIYVTHAELEVLGFGTIEVNVTHTELEVLGYGTAVRVTHAELEVLAALQALADALRARLLAYVPERAPEVVDIELRAVVEYVDRQLHLVADAINHSDNLLLPQLNVPPDKPRDGMVVLADGTNWNPGSGAGFYGYRSGSWQKLD